MKREILQGIFGGLAVIFCVVSLGSFIGVQLSHSPAPAPAAEQPAATP